MIDFSKTGCRLEYVMSGCSYARVDFKETHDNPEQIKWVTDRIKMITDASKYHDYSFLYNAFQEKDYGNWMKKNYASHIKNIYADSGGLQIVSRGIPINAEMKEKIYTNQAAYSSRAMSFDEIPVTLIGDKSAKTGTDGRYFDKSKFVECAIKTGKNLAEQIELFIKLESKSMPMFITQGNDLDTYCKWTELVLRQVPKEHHKYIGGVAMGGVALGVGKLEDIKKAFYFTQLPIETDNNHVHLLGIGSVTRLLPYIIFMQNGVFKDLYFSYDSTTHTSAPHTGRWYSNEHLEDFPKQYDKVIWPRMYEECKLKAGLDMSIEDMYKAMNTPSKVLEVELGSRFNVVKAFYSVITTSIINFIEHSDKMLESKEAVIKLAGKQKMATAYKALYDVKTLDDFKHWENQIGRHVRTNAVKDYAPANLDEFFS